MNREARMAEREWIEHITQRNARAARIALIAKTRRPAPKDTKRTMLVVLAVVGINAGALIAAMVWVLR